MLITETSSYFDLVKIEEEIDSKRVNKVENDVTKIEFDDF